MSSTLFWIVLQNSVNAITYLKRSPYITSLNQPDQLKRYPTPTRLYYSRIYKPANAQPGRLPLVIKVHGGGFVMNSPVVDDPIGRYLADNAGCTVVAIDYRKCPLNKFPGAYEDIVMQTLAVIEDPELNVDPAKVILCGTSAGGNLILGAAQDSRLQGKLLGVMAVTPLTDLTVSYEDKMASRPDPKIPDFLEKTYPSLSGLYLGTDVSPKDVRVSPTYFAKRTDLPQHIYINGAEHDMLCREAENMAEKLAQGLQKRKVENGWEAGTVKWNLIKGQKHAFEGFPEKEQDRDAIRLESIKTMFQSVGDWVKQVTKA